jgi:hypothetical protein
MASTVPIASIAVNAGEGAILLSTEADIEAPVAVAQP